MELMVVAAADAADVAVKAASSIEHSGARSVRAQTNKALAQKNIVPKKKSVVVEGARRSSVS